MRVTSRESRVARGAFLALCLLVPTASPSARLSAQSIADKVKGLTKFDGFIPLYWDAASGKLFFEVTPGQEMIYVVSLPAGLGSNDIGLDRGQLSGERIVRFDRVGPRVLLTQPNLRYRAASTTNPAEQRAIAESFATSTLWGFKVEAESDGKLLVDATDFALRDAHGVIGALQRTRQGSYRLDATRSALYLPRTRAFPRNSEIEVTLTFTGEPGGGYVRDVTPSPDAVTVRERHSFVALPEPGFEPREFDPRAGYFDFSWFDYSAPFPQPLTKRFITRHRLAKKDPSAAVSDPVTPIVYYLDPGVPEPVRTALLDGARWWNQAFEAAGYRNAFRVEVLPDTADPLDVRYNMIQWVHRATRGWSYGSSVTDPRTGEILKGHVTLGSLRIRQDYMLAEGLLLPYTQGTERSPEAEAMALARIRQLSAHEVGHTLGLSHNYISSTQGGASVMDYPHPLATLKTDGSIDLSQAYPEGIGAWDRVSVAWGYQDFPSGTDQKAALDRIIADARAKGLTYLTDQDARPTGSPHPQAHLWDNGADVVTELDRMVQLRRAVLDRFGEAAIKRGTPMATIEEVLVPLYFYHRYQVEAAVKVIGGQWYSLAVRGDGQTPVRAVPAAEQRKALESVLATIRPEFLALPRPLLAIIPPRPAGYDATRELFDRETGLSFDAVRPASTGADMVISLLLDEERAARLVQQHALDPAAPGLEDVLSRLVTATFGATPANGYHAELGRAVQQVVVERLMDLAATSGMPQVRAIAALQLEDLRRRLAVPAVGLGVGERAHRQLIASDIARFRARGWEQGTRVRRPVIPPGSPIGETFETLRP
ncbi:MAG TPA: zinc-dependent metalloprotease [Gemmatimonadales bacterium]|nr:zinc-dependent metalloprotease [Gemmatimonadales bacterium]